MECPKISSSMSEHEQTSENHNNHWEAAKKEGTVGICSKYLKIVWGDDWRFWKQVTIHNDENEWLKYEDGMELAQVCYLEVTGTLDLQTTGLLSANTTYELLYIIKFNIDAFGWQECPVSLHLAAPDVKRTRSIVNFEDYRKKGEGWHPVPGGEFTVGPTLHGKLSFGIYETETPFWKGGMILHGVLIKPKKSA